jgi:hypothetical protein
MGAYDSPGAAARYQQQGGVRYNPPNIDLTKGFGLGSPKKSIDLRQGFTLNRGGAPQSRPPAVNFAELFYGPRKRMPTVQVTPDKKAVAWQTGMDAVPMQYRMYQPEGYGAQPPSRPEQLFGSPVIYGGTPGNRGKNADALRYQGMADQSMYRAGFDSDAWWKRMQGGLYSDYVNYLMNEDQMQPDPDPVYYGGGYGGGWGGWGGYGGGGYKSPFDFFFNRMNWRI